MELPFVTLDVFTRTRFRGNPLAVVTIPAAGPKPSQAQKQAVAREFNLSETVFIHDVADHDIKHRQIDIFITTAELPFAGHPTIGAAVSLLAQGVNFDTLITKAGPIPIARVADAPDAARADIPHNVHLHARRLRDIRDLPRVDLSSVQEIAQAELDAPVFSIVKGMTFILVELPSLDLLQKVTLSPAVFPSEQLLDQDWQHGFLSRYYFVRTAEPHDRDGARVVSLRTRMIESSFEDPATGSAACCLSSYLSLTEHTDPNQSFRYDVTQGVEMGKESNIAVDVDLQDAKVNQVTLAGAAVQVMRGTITI
jgi:PhzF family phenazine biosynthesis protein